jgi:citrate lyase alpha subunit
MGAEKGRLLRHFSTSSAFVLILRISENSHSTSTITFHISLKEGFYMVKRILTIVTIVIGFVSIGLAQVAAEKVDTAVISKIKNEGLNNSQVQERR